MITNSKICSNSDVISAIAQKFSNLKEQFIVYYSFNQRISLQKIQYLAKYSHRQICTRGLVDILQKQLNNKILIQFEYDTLRIASQNGQTNILQWFLDNKFCVMYSQSAINLSKDVNTLNWWYNHSKSVNRQFKYSKKAIQKCFKNKRIDILNWLLRVDPEYLLKFKFSAQIFDQISIVGNQCMLYWIFEACAQNYISLQFDKASLDFANNTRVLDTWKFISEKYKITMFYSTNAIDKAKNTQILDWWLKSGLEFKYSCQAINNAINNGQYDIIRWWQYANFKYNLPLLYNNLSMDQASIQADIQKLNSWLISGLKLKYSSNAIDCLSSLPIQVSSLQWWVTSNLPLKYTDKAIDDASKNRQIKILDWWRDSRLPLKYSQNTIDLACKNKDFQVLNWWLKNHKKYGLRLKYTSHAVDYATANGHTDILTWWVNSGLIIKYTQKGIDQASQFAQFKSLNWWLKQYHKYKIKIKYSAFSIDEIEPITDWVSVLQWWYDSGLNLKYTNLALLNAYKYRQYSVIQWWFKQCYFNNIEIKCPSEILHEIYRMNKCQVMDFSPSKNLQLFF